MLKEEELNRILQSKKFEQSTHAQRCPYHPPAMRAKSPTQSIHYQNQMYPELGSYQAQKFKVKNALENNQGIDVEMPPVRSSQLGQAKPVEN